jgi:hypothetical protein
VSGQPTKEEPTTSTTKNGKAGPTISQSLVVAREQRLIKLVRGAIEFPTIEMKDKLEN